MSTWDEIRTKVKSWNSTSPAAVSSAASILDIIDAAEAWEMDPDLVDRIKKSNLQEIVKRAKQYISDKEKYKLNMLFQWAKDMTSTELRKKLRPRAFENILVEEVIKEEETLYRMELTEEQYYRMVQSSTRMFNFVIAKEKK